MLVLFRCVFVLLLLTLLSMLPLLLLFCTVIITIILLVHTFNYMKSLTRLLSNRYFFLQPFHYGYGRREFLTYLIDNNIIECICFNNITTLQRSLQS